MNTVIVLESKGMPEGDTTRFVQTNIPTRLLAFDGTLTGKGFSFGDGKSSAYFAEGWKTKDQQVSWTIRTIEPATFKVIIKYVSTPETAGSYILQAGADSFKGNVESSSKNTIITKELGILQLPSSINNIKISPAAITGSELMKILEVQLIPILKK
jgi:hypothetical protein